MFKLTKNKKQICRKNRNKNAEKIEINYSKLNRFYELINPRIEAGVKITLVIESPDISFTQDYQYIMGVIKQLQSNGVLVAISDNTLEKYTVIDNSIVWHRSVNFLGKDDVWDNLMRIEDPSVASELNEMTFANINDSISKY